MATNGPSPYARSMGWRDMTAEEVATLPEARLRWVLDPLGTCPDCEDNALEPTPT